MIKALRKSIGKTIKVKLNWGSSGFVKVSVIQPLEEDYESYMCRVEQDQDEFKAGSLIEVSQSNLLALEP
jgi:ferredoxin-fold anticodon binding domain-containing protein